MEKKILLDIAGHQLNLKLKGFPEKGEEQEDLKASLFGGMAGKGTAFRRKNCTCNLKSI